MVSNLNKMSATVDKFEALTKRRFDGIPTSKNVEKSMKEKIEEYSNSDKNRRRASEATLEKFEALTKKHFDGMPRQSAGDKSLKDRVSLFNEQAAKTQKKLEKNPFSDQYKQQRHSISDESYGRPEAGTLTERRGIAAGNHIGREILELCEVINDYGIERPDGTHIITFGDLFLLYTKISEKVVGMLLRARKHGLVEFEGEMLFQRRDEDTIITLLKPLDEIKQSIVGSNDPSKCLTTNK